MLMQSHMYIILYGYFTINYFLTELHNYSMIKLEVQTTLPFTHMVTLLYKYSAYLTSLY